MSHSSDSVSLFLNLKCYFQNLNSEQKVVKIKMSNHQGAVGREKTKNSEIIRSHQAFTFGTVPLDPTVFFDENI